MDSSDSPTKVIRYSMEHLFMIVIPLVVKMGYGMDIAQCAVLSHETFCHKARVGILNDVSYPTVEDALLMSPYTLRHEKAMKFKHPLTAFFMLRGEYMLFRDTLYMSKFKLHVRHRMAFISGLLWTTLEDGPVHFVPQAPFDDHANVEQVPPDHYMVSLRRGIKIIHDKGEASSKFDPISLIETENYTRYYSMTIIFDVIHDEDCLNHPGLRRLFAVRDFVFPAFSIHWDNVQKQLAYAFDMFCSVFSTTIINRRYLSEPYYSETVTIARPRYMSMPQWRKPYDPVLGTRVDVFSFMTCIAQSRESRTRSHKMMSDNLCEGFAILFAEIANMEERYSQFPGSPYKAGNPSQSLAYKFPIGVSPIHYMINGQYLEPLKLWLRCANFPRGDYLVNTLYTNRPGLTPTTPLQYARTMFYTFYNDPTEPELDHDHSFYVKIRNVQFLQSSQHSDLFNILWLLYEHGAVEACDTTFIQYTHLTPEDRIAAQAFGLSERDYKLFLSSHGKKFEMPHATGRMWAPKFYGWMPTDYDKRERDLTLKESIDEMGYYSA